MVLYVNGKKIDPEEIKGEAERLRPQHDQVFADKPEEDREKQLAEWARENVIERELLRQANERDGEKVSPGDIEKAYYQMLEQQGGEDEFFKQTGLSRDKIDDIKMDLGKQIKFERFLEKLTSNIEPPTEEEIEHFYNANIQNYTVPEMVKASHIVKHATPGSDLKALREELDAILSEIHKGASFEELADNNSDCEDRGGDLGFFPRGQMVQEFEDVVFSLDVGQISEVFQSPFGFHIAKVTDKKAACPAPIEEAKPHIIEELTSQAKQKIIENFIDAEKEKAVIEDK